MTAPLHWVVGSGGLLGSALTRAIARRGEPRFDPGRIRWSGTTALDDLSAAAEQFDSERGTRPWRLHWCAGAGVTGSGHDDLFREVDLFERFLDRLGCRGGGSLFLASSVGAVYGGSPHPPYTEDTIPQPIGHYGAAKLAMEDAAQRWSARSGVPVAIGRISNLYGPGQRLDKTQGLISRLCLAAIVRQPLQIFVPLDTRRDYIYVDDCADLAVDTAERAAAGGGATVKILGAGATTSVGGLIGCLRRVSAVSPPIVMTSSPLSLLQAPDLRVASHVWRSLDRRPKVPLAEGVGRTMAALRLAYAQGAVR